MSSVRSLVTGLLIAALAHVAAGPAAAQPAGALPIDIRGAERLEYDGATGVLVAEGTPVIITRGQSELRAPRVRYDARTRIITAEGGVTATEPGLSLRGGTAELRLTNERIRMRGDVQIRSERDDGTAVLSAHEVEGSLQTRQFVALGGVTVTRGEWTVTGRRLDYDDRSRLAVMTGEPVARLKDASMAAQTITFLIAEERARGEGDVVVRRGEIVGRAPRAEIIRRDNRAVLSGGARVDRGADRVTAEVIEIDLDGNRVTARGASRLIVTPP
jgi:lipopolysaccharide export system protein LptA